MAAYVVHACVQTDLSEGKDSAFVVRQNYKWSYHVRSYHVYPCWWGLSYTMVGHAKEWKYYSYMPSAIQEYFLVLE